MVHSLAMPNWLYRAPTWQRRTPEFQARYSGFCMQRELAPPTLGEHILEVQVRNGLDDLQELRLVIITSNLALRRRRYCLKRQTSFQEFRFHLDSPAVICGTVPETMAGHLVVEGWALAGSGVQEMEIFSGEQSLGKAHYGTTRRDVEAAFPR